MTMEAEYLFCVYCQVYIFSGAMSIQVLCPFFYLGCLFEIEHKTFSYILNIKHIRCDLKMFHSIMYIIFSFYG